jgi:hypothetical protein
MKRKELQAEIRKLKQDYADHLISKEHTCGACSVCTNILDVLGVARYLLRRKDERFRNRCRARH